MAQKKASTAAKAISTSAPASSTNQVKKPLKKKSTSVKRPIKQKPKARTTKCEGDGAQTQHNEPSLEADNANAFPFLRLPSEIRMHIYFHASKVHNMRVARSKFHNTCVSSPVLRLSSGLSNDQDTTQPRPDAHEYTLHNLLRVSHQVYAEVIHFMHKNVPVSVRLNVPSTQSEFGSGFDPLGCDDDDANANVYDDFDDDAEMGDDADINVDDEDKHAYALSQRHRPDGPVKRELRKWQHIEVHAYRGSHNYCARIADDLRGFLRWVDTWDTAAGTTVMLHLGNFFLLQPKAHPFEWSWDYRSLKVINTWIKKQKPEKLKHIELILCKPLGS